MAGDVPVPIADVEADAGRWVEALFQAPAGIKLVGASEDMTWKQWLDVWSEHNQVATRYRELPPEDFPPELKAITEPMVQVFKFVEEFGYTGGDPEALRIDDVSFPACCGTLSRKVFADSDPASSPRRLG